MMTFSMPGSLSVDSTDDYDADRYVYNLIYFCLVRISVSLASFCLLCGDDYVNLLLLGLVVVSVTVDAMSL